MKNKSSQVASSTRTLFLLAIVAGLLIAFCGYVYYSFEERAITQTKHEEIKAITDLKIGQIKQWRKERISDAEVSSQSTFFIKGINRWIKNSNDKLLENEIINRLQPVKNNDIYKDIFLGSVNGELLLSNNPKEKKFDPFTSLKIIEAVKSGQIIFTDFYYCQTHHKIHFDIIAPVIVSNHPIAVLLFRVDPDKYLYPLIQSWPTPSKTSETLLARKDGDSVLFLNDLRLQNNTKLNLRIPLTQKEVPAVQAILGFKGIFEGNDYRGKSVLAYIEPIPDTPWFMVAKVDHSEIFAELQFRAVFISAFSLILIILAGAGFSLVNKARQKNILQELLTKEKELRLSQEVFKTTLYSIGDAVITTDVNCVIQQMNPVAEQLTGWQESEAKGISIDKVFRIINEETRNVVENPVNRVLKVGLIVGLANHTLLISKDGKETPIADSGAPIKNQEGEILGVVLVFRDQSEERNKTNELMATKENLRAIFENNASAIAIIEPNTTISMVNQAYCRISGYTEQEVIGMSWTQQIPPEELDRLKEYNHKRFTNPDDAPDKYEFKFCRKDGEIRTGLMSVSMIQNPQKIIASFIDITDLKHAEEEVRETDKHNHTLADSGQALIWTSCLDKKCNYFNIPWLNFTGRTLEQELGDGWIEGVHPDDFQRCVEIYVGAFDRREKFSMDYRIRHASGDYRWIQDDGTPRYNSKAEFIGYIGHCLDITERKWAEEALKESEQKYHSLFNEMIEGFAVHEIICNEDGVPVDYRFLMINPSFEKLTGLKSEVTVGKTVQEVIPGIEPFWIETYGKVALTGESVVFENYSKELDRYFRVIAFSHEKGQFAVLFEDITERKKMEQALTEAKENLEKRVTERTAQLEAANKELEAFSYSVSHDLRAPLRHINGYIDLLNHHFPDSMPDKANHYLKTISDSVRQMGLLIDDLLDFSRTGRLELKRTDIDMNNLLQEALATIEQDSKERTIQWIISPFPPIFGDFNLLKLVWYNLLSNAVKFTRKKEKASIDIGFQEENNELIFFVRDNGDGFDMLYVHKLFGVFQRLHSAADYEGTGIGLANVQRIILRHGGRVWAEAEQDKGATFYFTLPKNKEGKS